MAEDRRPHLWASILLFALALAPRLHAIWQGFITPDEPMWVFRALRFSQALQVHRWADTFQVGHPGVITMWLGALGIAWEQFRHGAAAAAHLAWIDRVAWVAPDNADLFRHLAPFLPPARTAMAVLTSLGIVGMYVLACRLWDRRLALVGALFLAFDPFLIALSGLLHVDAPAATFMALGLLAWLNALDSTRPQGGSLPLPAALFALLAGLCSGLAILSKSPAAFMGPAVVAVALLVFLLGARPTWRRLGQIAMLGAIWAAGTAAAAFGAFPAMWVDPLGVLKDIYGLAGGRLDMPYHDSFFRGIGGGDPGPLFYPTVFLFRLTPVVLVGLLFSLWPLLTGWRSPQANRRRAIMAALWTFAIGLTAFLTVAAEKFDRYLLPAFVALDLLAAVGWVELLRLLYAGRYAVRALRRGPRAQDMGPVRAFVAVAAALAIAQAAMVLPTWPYYLDAYNPLVGGLGEALRTLPVGWGEGLEQVALHLRRTAPAQGETVIAGASPVTLAPLIDGRVLPLDRSSLLLADKVLITAIDRQIYPQHVAGLISGARLEYVLRMGGQEVLWLYDTNLHAEADHLAQYGAPRDAILCDAPSPFARHASPGTVYLLAEADEAEIVAALNRWTASHTRLWYLAYPSSTTDGSGSPGSTELSDVVRTAYPTDWTRPVASPITAAAIRRQLDTYAYELDRVDLGYVLAMLYLLPAEPVFQVSVPDAGAAFRPANLGPLSVVEGALLKEPVAADEGVRLRLRWRARSVPQADYTVFLHLLDAAGHMRTAGRGEELLVDHRYWPTSAWGPGEGVELDFRLGFPPGLPPGRYWIAVGLADSQTGAWLPVLDEQGQMRGTTASVLPVEVGPTVRLPDPAESPWPRPADVVWQDRLRLLGYGHLSRASVGQTLVVDLGWLGLKQMDQDYAVRLSLVGADAQVAYQVNAPLSAYPTSRWRPGEMLHELYDLTLPATLPGGTYTLSLEVLDRAGASLAGPVQLGQLEISVEERLFALPRPPQVPLDLTLGQGISLLGYDLPQQDVQAGDPLSLTLYWQCTSPVEASLTAFVHLLDASGQVQGQQDQIPGRGRSPTSGWVAGQVIVDEYELSLRPDLPAGEYRLEVGMYDARDMVRLPIVDASGNRLPDDRALLQAAVTIVARP